MTPADYKSERIKRGLSQAALAALVGVSRGCINYREAGHPRYPITAEAWLAICSLPVHPPKKARRAKGQNTKLANG
jgi:DNA-binding XRE family transcriptional regulator